MLSVRGMSFSYNMKPTLSEVSFDVGAGELCSVLGNNGAGKSTLLKCLLGILEPAAGTVLADGNDASMLGRMEKARLMGYVPQRESECSRLKVFDAVLTGRRPHLSWGAGAHDLEVVRDSLAALNLEGLSLRYLDQLSGGELQKVVIARALAQEPGIMLLDEPTSNLDLRNQLEVMSILKQMVEERGISALVAIHDVNLALRFSRKFLLLKGGSILACGGLEVMSPENIEELYGVTVEVEERRGRKVVIPMEPALED